MMIYTYNAYSISQDWRKVIKKKKKTLFKTIHNKKKKNPTIYLPVNIYKFCFVLKFFRFWGIFLRSYIYQLILAAHNKTAVWLLSAEIIKGFLTQKQKSTRQTPPNLSRHHRQSSNLFNRSLATIYCLILFIHHINLTH